MNQKNPFSGNPAGATRAPKAAQVPPQQPPKQVAPRAKAVSPMPKPELKSAPKVVAPKPAMSTAAVQEAKQERSSTTPLSTNAAGELGKVGKDGVFRPDGWNKAKKRVRKEYTEKDFYVLALCAFAGAITKRMAVQVLGVSEGTAYNRLRGLARSGMLEAVVVPPTQVYVLKRKALSFLNSYGLEEEQATLMTAEQVFGGRETKHILGRGQWLASWIAELPEEARIPFMTGEGTHFISEVAIKANSLAVWEKEDSAIERVAAIRTAQSAWKGTGHSQDFLLENLRTFQYCQSTDRLGRPDGVVFDPKGNHAAVEIETARKSTPEYDRILGFFAEDERSPFAGVIYVVSDDKIERAIRRSRFCEPLEKAEVLRIERLKDAKGNVVNSTREVWKL